MDTWLMRSAYEQYPDRTNCLLMTTKRSVYQNKCCPLVFTLSSDTQTCRTLRLSLAIENGLWVCCLAYTQISTQLHKYSYTLEDEAFHSCYLKRVNGPQTTVSCMNEPYGWKDRKGKSLTGPQKQHNVLCKPRDKAGCRLNRTSVQNLFSPF